MKKRAFFRIFLVIVLSLAYLLNIIAVHAATSGYTGSTNNGLRIAGTEDWLYVGEYLSGLSERTITSLSFKLKQIGSNTTGYISYKIFQSDDTLLRSEYVMMAENVSAGETVYEHTLIEPITVSGNIRIVVACTDNVADSNYIVVMVKSGTDVFEGGELQYKPQSGGWDGAGDSDAYFSYFYGEAPTITDDGVTDIEYNPLYNDYDATFTFTVDDDGGDNTTHVCAYYLDTEEDPGEGWLATCSLDDYGAIRDYTTGQSGNITVQGAFEIDQTYWYFIRAYNAIGSDYDPEDYPSDNFTIAQGSYAPDIRTLTSPITLDIDGLTAMIYGDVIDYGGANVTAWFQWRPYATGNYTETANITDLQTGDIFSANLTGLSLGVTYEYYAEALNAYGNTTGSIATFQLLQLTSPEIETLPAEYITASSAYLSGNLTDLGNDTSVDVYIEYREAGETEWLESTWSFAGATGKTTTFIVGLAPTTQYEFRAVARANILGGVSYYDYGDVFTFYTLSDNSIPIMQTGNATWLSQGFIMLNSYVYYDGGSEVEVYSEYREQGVTGWSETAHTHGAESYDEVSQFASGLEDDKVYEYRSIGVNSVGSASGSIRIFYLTTDNTTQDEDTDIDGGEAVTISDFLNDIKSHLGLTGIMGEWAFMFILELLVAVLFGIALVSVERGWQKSAIAFSWILASASVVGGFLFSGRLGVFTVIVAVGAVVAIVLIFISTRLSGSGGDL